MMIVAVYKFLGRYSGNSEYDWRHPAIGATHKCLLFLRQSDEVGGYAEAERECERYGFTDVVFTGQGNLQVEVLNTDEFRGFAGFYETALSDGSSLVYYPNTGSNAVVAA